MPPKINLSEQPATLLPNATLFIEQDTAGNPDPQTAYVQRVVNTDDGITNPKAVRARTVINAETTGAEWAVSGEIVSHSDTLTAGHTATSGVAEKHGLAQVFGGHFQAKDFNAYPSATDVTSVVGVEVNVQGIGPDHPAGHGLRRAVDVIARTAAGNASEGEIGVGVNVRSDTLTGGTFRTAIAVSEGNAPITTGVSVATSGPVALKLSGANSTAQILSEGQPLYGAIFNGSYGKAAVRIGAGQALAMEATATVRMTYAGGVWGFFNGINERVGFDMTSNPGVRVGGQKIVGKRGGPLPPAATDLASAITLLNALRDRLSAGGDHGLFS